MIFYFLGAGALAFFFIAKNRVAEEIGALVVENSDSWTRFDSLFQKYGAQNGVDWRWLKAICMNESSLGEAESVAIGIANPYDIERSKSYDGKSWGVMQFTLPTARQFDPLATEIKLNNPEYSIKLSGQFFKYLKTRFDSSSPRFLEMVIKSYNQGEGNSKKELAGKIEGYAGEYWARFQRNLARAQKG